MTGNDMCDIRSFGAVGDGLTLDTGSIQKAVDAVSGAGGGTVLVPPGTFLTGTVFLKSNVTIRLAKSATLLGAPLYGQYRRLPEKDDPEGRCDEYRCMAILLAYGQENIRITGEGTIDGQGAVFVKDAERLLREGKIVNPWSGSDRPQEIHRPMLISLYKCRGIDIEGITLKDSACWVQNYTDCEDLRISRIRVDSHAFWNNDGVDVTGCRRVRISDCDIDSSDDAICLKSNGSACEDIVITNCVLRSFANALKFGTMSCGGFVNISVSNLAIRGAGHSGVALECVDGGRLENVAIRGVVMRDVRHGIFLRQAARFNGFRKKTVPGGFRNVILSDMTVEVSAEGPDKGQPLAAPVWKQPHNSFPCHASGLPGYPLEGITLSDIHLVTPAGSLSETAEIPLDRLDDVPENEKGYPEYNMLGELPAFGWYFRHVKGLVMRNLSVKAVSPDFRPAFLLDDVENADLSGLKSEGSSSPLLALRRMRGAVLGVFAAAEEPAELRILDGCTGIVRTTMRSVGTE